MPYSTRFKNMALDMMLTSTLVSLHDAPPGDDGGNELVGGSPPYARQWISFYTASEGAKLASSDPVFDVPAQTAVTHVGFWAGSGEFLGWTRVDKETFAGQGTYTLTSARLDLNG